MAGWLDKYSDGGELKKMYTDKAEYDQAMQMYSDSLTLYNFNTASLAQAEVDKLGYLSYDARDKLTDIDAKNWRGDGYDRYWDAYNRLSSINKEAPDRHDKDFYDKNGYVNFSHAIDFSKPKQKPIYDNSAELLKAKQEKFSSIGGSYAPVVMHDTQELKGYKFRTERGEKFVPLEDTDSLKKISNMYGLDLEFKLGGAVPNKAKNTYNNWLDKL